MHLYMSFFIYSNNQFGTCIFIYSAYATEFHPNVLSQCKIMYDKLLMPLVKFLLAYLLRYFTLSNVQISYL